MQFSENDLSKIVITTAIKIHRTLGPGLLESVYESVLYYELSTVQGFIVERQKVIPLQYNGLTLERSFVADLIIEGRLLLELKSVRRLEDVHKKQTLTYLRLTGLKLGLLINFNQALLKDGLVRIVNGLSDEE